MIASESRTLPIRDAGAQLWPICFGIVWMSSPKIGDIVLGAGLPVDYVTHCDTLVLGR